MLTATFPARSDLVSATKRAYDAFTYRARSIASPPAIPWELLYPGTRQAWIDAAQELVDSVDFDPDEIGLQCSECSRFIRKCLCRKCRKEKIIDAIQNSSRAQGETYADHSF
jgi:hypothetical protein